MSLNKVCDRMYRCRNKFGMTRIILNSYDKNLLRFFIKLDFLRFHLGNHRIPNHFSE